MLKKTQFTDLLQIAPPKARTEVERFLFLSEKRTGSSPKAEQRLLETLSLSLHLRRSAN
jgi:hypothetical protein